MTQWVSTVKNLLVGALRWLSYWYYWLLSAVYSLVGRISDGFNLDSSGLRTIAEVQAAVLAIVFSLSLFTIEQAASRYSSRIMAEYRRDRFTKILLASFVGNVVLALWVGSFQWDAQSGAQRLLFAFILAWCSANLIALFFYYRHISALVDPLKLQAKIHGEAVRAVKAVDRGNLLRAIASIGDIALGTVERGREQAIVEPVLDNLQDIFVQFYALKATDRMSYENLFLSKELRELRELAARDPHGWQSAVLLGRVRCEPLGAILDQMSRLHKTAIHVGAGEVGRATAYRLIRILRRVCGEEDNEMLVKQIVDEIRRLSLEAIKHQAPSMYAFGAHWYRDIIALGGLGGEFHMPYLSTISKALFEINKLILDEGDFDVFKEQLSFLSFIRLPNRALGDLQSVLNRYVMALAEKHSQVGRHVPAEIWGLPRNLTEGFIPLYSRAGREMFEDEFDKVQRWVRENLDLNPVERARFEELEREIGDTLDELEKVARTFEIFFVVGAYCIFKHRFEFIKEIWTHTTPEDRDAHWVNQNLVFFDAPYLMWQVYAEPLLEMAYDFGGYHGSGTYLKQYLLLCLARCSGQPALPPIPARDEVKVSQYHILTSFLHDIPRLRELCDILIGEEAGLDPLFPGRAQEALERTKEYLHGVVSVCEQRRKEIIKLLPLVEEKIEGIIRSIEGEYAELSEVGRIAGVVDYDEQAHGALEFQQIRVRAPVPREVLTKLGGVMMTQEVVQYVTQREQLHLMMRILEALPEARATRQEPAVRELLEATCQLKQRGYEPHAVLVPLTMFEWVHRSMPLEYENGDPYVVIDDEARCRVVWTRNEWEMKRLVVLGQDCGEWVRKKPFGIEVSGEEGMEVEFLVEEEICFDLRKVEAIEMV